MRRSSRWAPPLAHRPASAPWGVQGLRYNRYNRYASAPWGVQGSAEQRRASCKPCRLPAELRQPITTRKTPSPRRPLRLALPSPGTRARRRGSAARSRERASQKAAADGRHARRAHDGARMELGHHQPRGLARHPLLLHSRRLRPVRTGRPCGSAWQRAAAGAAWRGNEHHSRLGGPGVADDGEAGWRRRARPLAFRGSRQGSRRLGRGRR